MCGLPVISRAEAMTAGLNRYFTGKPCRNGHVAERHVTGGTCVECNKSLVIAWREENREKKRASDRERIKADPERKRTYTRNRAARKKGAEGKHTKAEIAGLLTKQRGRCANCKTLLSGKYHADHIGPLAKGGTNWIRNIQLLCPSCNLRKGAKDPLHFARENGLLL